MSAPMSAPPQVYGTPAPKQSNGLAVAGLVFGIIGVSLLGLIFGILGLSRAKKVGGKGRTMSWVAIVLSVLWIAGAGIFVAVVGSDLLKASNPGCVAAKTVIGDSAQLTTANGDLDDITAQLKITVNGLNDAAAKSNDADTTVAIKALAEDYQQLLDAFDSLTPPSPALTTKLATDAHALDQACGTIGS